MPRLPSLFVALAMVAFGCVYGGGQASADTQVSPAVTQPSALPAGTAVTTVSYPQVAPDPQPIVSQPRKPPRIWLFMGFGF